MWKRNTQDPLIRTFLEKYNFHLLSVPRKDSAVGDLYVIDGKKVSSPGQITYFLDPPMEMPPIKTGERMADVSGIFSQSVSYQIGVGYLTSFLMAMTAGGVINKVRTTYEKNKVDVLKFRFADAKRDSIDPLLMGSKIIRHKVLEEHALYDKSYRYYLVTAVARSSSISIIAESEESKAIDIDVRALALGEVSTGITVEKISKSEVIFIGEDYLGFGVQLFELVYDAKRKKIKFKLPKGAIKVMKASEPILKPAIIGGPNDDIFLTIE